MIFKRAIEFIVPEVLRRRLGRSSARPRISNYRFSSSSPSDVREHIEVTYKHESDLLDIFVATSESQVNKWHHYIPIYDRYLSSLRSRPVRFLEIGVAQGGSLRLWREYLGERAVVYGIDVAPECAQFDGMSGQVRIGSQADPEFLLATVQEMGGIDVVLDDGSHRMEHIRKSLNVLFPLLNEGGLYIIEDLHTAYFKKFGGGYGARDNFFRLIAELVDDMHRWYHTHGSRHAHISDFCTGIHVFDSLVVLEKNRSVAPVFSKMGPQ